MDKIILVKPPLSRKKIYGKLAEAGSSEPPLGLCYLASNLRKHGIEVQILDAMILNLSYEETVDAILKSGAGYVGLTAMTIDVFNAANVAKLLKDKDPQKTIILGGVHITAVPKETMERFPQFDIGVINEGEITLVELMQALIQKSDLKNINGIIYRDNGNIALTQPRPFNHKLDDLPMPAWDLLPHLPKFYASPPYSLERSPSSSIITSRGCGSKCTFCFQGALGRSVRMHGTEYSLNMIKHLYYEYGIRNIRVLDDNFVLNRLRIKEICRELINAKLDLTFSCLSRVDTVDPDLLKMLKEAGCWQVLYGIESGSQRILDSIKKKVTLEQIRQAVQWTREAKLRSLGYFMIGFPTETEETIKETIAFAKSLPLDDFKMNILAPFPGTEIYATGDQYGSINRDWDAMNMYTEPAFVAKDLTKELIIGYRKKAFKEFYLRPVTIWSYLKSLRNMAQLKKLFKGSIALARFWLSSSN